MKKLLFVIPALLAASVPLVHADGPSASVPGSTPVTAAAVDQCVDRAVAWIESQQQNGNWERVQVPTGRTQWDHVSSAQWGGLTALATLTLLEAGVSPNDPHVAAGVKFLLSANIVGNYTLALRARVWPLLPRTPQIMEAAQADLRRMFGGMKTEKEALGFYHYYLDENKGTDYDHSVSAYIANGVAAVQGMGFEVPDKYWQLTEAAWRRDQMPDGGWPYVKVGDTTMTMTTSGVDVLFIAQDALRRNIGVECRPVPTDPAITKGLAWIDQNLDKAFDVHILPEFALANYTLYYLSRIASVAGVKYFNKTDWYLAGAAKIVSDQRPEGYWGDPNNNIPQYHLPDTCLGVLFLATGRAPVMMEKMQYGVADAAPATPGAAPTPAGSEHPIGEVWDERPRDVANVVQWAGEQMEATLNWQVVNWDLSLQDLHDSSVMYLSGNQALKLSQDQVNKLKLFIDQGGLLLANSNCDAEAFNTSIRDLARQMYPQYAFAQLPEKHPIYTEEQFPRTKWHRRMGVQGLANGVRELILFVPDSDIGRAYQMQQTQQHLEAFQFAADVYQYMGGRAHPREKGDRYTVEPDPSKHPSHTISVARLQYGGNWNPEPAGWPRLAAIMNNERDTDVQLAVVPSGTGKLDNTYLLTDVTGTGTLTLSAGCRQELKTYVDKGGTVLFDAAGGDAVFGDSAESELKSIFPDQALKPIPDDDPLFTAAPALGRVTYRLHAQATVGNLHHPMLKGIRMGNRWAVIESPLDISNGLVGNDIDGINGYTPDSATRIAEAIVAAAATPPSATPTTQK